MNCYLIILNNDDYKISKGAVKATFSKSVNTYDAAAVLQREVLARLLARVKLLSKQADCLLDLGSGTGLAREELQSYFNAKFHVELDIALPMLLFANANLTNRTCTWVCSDAESLPFKAESFNLIFSASMLQWCNDIDNVFRDCLRTLCTNGLFIFSLFGPETLQELRHCFAEEDPQPHVISFSDMHVIGDQLLQAGFHAPVMETETMTVEYQDPMQLLLDLKSTGATNNLANRSRGLLTKRRLNAVLQRYQDFRLPNGKYPATYEIVYGHAWKHASGEDEPFPSEEWQPIEFV